MATTPNPGNGNSYFGPAAPMTQPPKSAPLGSLRIAPAYPKPVAKGPAIKRPWGAINR